MVVAGALKLARPAAGRAEVMDRPQVSVFVRAVDLKKPVGTFIAEQGERVCREKGLAGFVSLFEGSAEVSDDILMESVCSLRGQLFIAQTKEERPPGCARFTSGPLSRRRGWGVVSCLTQHVLDAHFVQTEGYDDPVERLFRSQGFNEKWVPY